MSSALMARARALVESNGRTMAALAVLPLASIAQPASAALVSSDDLSLDAAYVGYWNASGFFTQPAYYDEDFRRTFGPGTPEGATLSAIGLDAGLKLYGSATMSDAVLGSVDGDRFFSGNEVYGLAFAWTGGLATPAELGDFLALDYEFDLQFTGEGPVSYTVTAGFATIYGDAYVPRLYSSTNPNLATRGESSGYLTEAGSYALTGSVTTDQLGENNFDETASYQWFVSLTAYWSDPDLFNVTKSGDTLTVTVPQNSIDVGRNAVPGVQPPTDVPAPSALALLAAGVAFLLRRRAR
jgi:MYXO-CTERM domain-containing protein